MRKQLALLCLLLTFIGLVPVLPVLPVQAQQNVASNPLGCTLTAQLATGTATAKVVSASPTTSFVQTINGVATTITTTKAIKICAIFLQVKQAAGAAAFGLILGTGTNCATGPANVTPQFFGTASVIDKFQQEYTTGNYIVVTPGKDVCMKVSAAPTDMLALILYKYE